MRHLKPKNQISHFTLLRFWYVQHASHVSMSTVKLMSRIVAPGQKLKMDDGDFASEELHDHTYGITSDPLTQFSVVLSALIHDVDHRGVPNFVLAQEDSRLATVYHNKSVAEQNSIDVAWEVLMDDEFRELRRTIYTSCNELHRFRQLVVNSVMATDIFDKELSALRKARWEKAFGMDESFSPAGTNRKATIVIEHLIQASDVAHTMQHWVRDKIVVPAAV
jgi:3'5'-cyclic nucleotide phosphodiesterase